MRGVFFRNRRLFADQDLARKLHVEHASFAFPPRTAGREQVFTVPRGTFRSLPPKSNDFQALLGLSGGVFVDFINHEALTRGGGLELGPLLIPLRPL